MRIWKTDSEGHLLPTTEGSTVPGMNPAFPSRILREDCPCIYVCNTVIQKTKDTSKNLLRQGQLLKSLKNLYKSRLTKGEKMIFTGDKKGCCLQSGIFLLPELTASFRH